MQPQPQLIARLQAYLRDAGRSQSATQELGPFTLFLQPSRLSATVNYAIPSLPLDTPTTASATDIERLTQTFIARSRQPRVEWLDEYAPALAPLLRASGFVEEERQTLLICHPTDLPADPLRLGPPALQIATLDAASPLDAMREHLDTNERGFATTIDEPLSIVDIQRFQAELGSGKAFTARLNGLAIATALYQQPRDGMTELMGVTTLEPYRRRGVAAALTAFAAHAAFAQGCALVFLIAANERASHVYQRVGFRPTATALVYSYPPTRP